MFLNVLEHKSEMLTFSNSIILFKNSMKKYSHLLSVCFLNSSKSNIEVQYLDYSMKKKSFLLISDVHLQQGQLEVNLHYH